MDVDTQQRNRGTFLVVGDDEAERVRHSEGGGGIGAALRPERKLSKRVTCGQCLQELALLRPLLENRLFRLTAYFPDPVDNCFKDIPDEADGSIVIGDVMAATMYRAPRVLRLIAAKNKVPDFNHISADERRQFIRNLMREDGEDFEWMYRQAESLVYGTADPDAYCPHFPNGYQYGIFKKLLFRNSKRIEKLNVEVIMELNSGCSIDPDNIEVDELLDIRRDEQVFSSWRELVRNSVNMAEARKRMTTPNLTFSRMKCSTEAGIGRRISRNTTKDA